MQETEDKMGDSKWHNRTILECLASREGQEIQPAAAAAAAVVCLTWWHVLHAAQWWGPRQHWRWWRQQHRRLQLLLGRLEHDLHRVGVRVRVPAQHTVITPLMLVLPSL
jgi:hypothetical protein